MKHSSTIAFDDHGDRVRSVPFIYPAEPQDLEVTADDIARIQREAVMRFLMFIVGDDFTVENTGRRALLAAYSFRLDGGPKTHAMLAEKFGLTRSALSHRLKSFALEMANALADSPKKPQMRQQKQAHRKS